MLLLISVIYFSTFRPRSGLVFAANLEPNARTGQSAAGSGRDRWSAQGGQRIEIDWEAGRICLPPDHRAHLV